MAEMQSCHKLNTHQYWYNGVPNSLHRTRLPLKLSKANAPSTLQISPISLHDTPTTHLVTRVKHVTLSTPLCLCLYIHTAVGSSMQFDTGQSHENCSSRFNLQLNLTILITTLHEDQHGFQRSLRTWFAALCGPITHRTHTQIRKIRTIGHCVLA